jgi:protein-L-isoaspartate(D-aspartate) O-methyltransferase
MTNPSPATLAARLKRSGVLTDPAVEAALLAVPRHLFLPGVSPGRVYRDDSVPLKQDERGGIVIASTQPSMTVRMLQQLDLRPGQNVLQVGAGSGYTAALIQQIVGDQGRVTAVEIDRQTAAQAKDNLQRALKGSVMIVEADGVQGYDPRAGYDRILVNATVWDIPDSWVRQLRNDGVLVAPLWLNALQYSAGLRMRAGDALESARNYPCTFVPLRGLVAGPRMSVRVGGSALTLTGDVSHLDSAALHLLFSEQADIDYLSTPLVARQRQRNLLPYVMLNLPEEFIFCLFAAAGDLLPYGMNQRGFAVLARGSAVFVSLEGDFKAWVFGGADAFVATQETISQWRARKMPGDEALRIRLTARGSQDSVPAAGVRVYPRTYRDIHVWQE